MVLPLTCTAPVNFGSLSLGQTVTVQASCTAKAAITVNGCTTSLATFQCQNSSLPTTVASGGSFSFPVTWNLTRAAINQAQLTGSRILPGSAGGSLDIFITPLATYAIDTPIQLSGVIVAAQGYLVINATQVDFGGIVLGGSTTTISRSMIISNTGTSPLMFTGFAWQDVNVAGMPFANVSVQTNSVVGNGFTATNFPAVGSQLVPGQSITISLSFSESTAGTWGSQLTFWSDSGSANVLFTGTASAGPSAVLSISDGAGNWVTSPLSIDFGNVLAGVSIQRQIRLCNTGGSALTITLSQPPTGADLTALDPILELRQGTTVEIGACSYGTVVVIAPPIQPNHPSIPLTAQWALNTDDGSFGLHTVSITATVISRQVGPLSNGIGLYQFLGCYYDGGGRNLATSTTNATNTIESCLNYCNGLGYSVAGTEYHIQCELTFISDLPY